MKTVEGYPIDLTLEETVDALSVIEARIVEDDDAMVAIDYPWHNCEVLYNGEWLTLSRTDLKDDIGTHINHFGRNPQDVVQEHIRKCTFGARVGKKYFSVIDAWSDG